MGDLLRRLVFGAPCHMWSTQPQGEYPGELDIFTNDLETYMDLPLGVEVKTKCLRMFKVSTLKAKQQSLKTL